MKTYTDTLLVSGVLNKDSGAPATMDMDTDYRLHCRCCEIRCESAVSHLTAIDGTAINSVTSVHPLRIIVKGVTSVNEEKSISDSITALSGKPDPFSITVGGQTFDGVLLTKEVCTVDSYGLTADCTLLFEKVRDGSEACG